MTALAAPVFPLASSSSNSIRKLVSSSSIAVASAPGPCPPALKRLHRLQQIPGSQRRTLRKNASNHPGEGLLGIPLFTNQQLIDVVFDRNCLGSHAQIMHGPCMAVKQSEGVGTACGSSGYPCQRLMELRGKGMPWQWSAITDRSWMYSMLRLFNGVRQPYRSRQ